MSDTRITCPKCAAEIPLNEAVSHRLREELKADFEKERAALAENIAAREKQLSEAQSAIAMREKAIKAEIERGLEIERKNLLAEASRTVEDKLGTQLKDLQAQVVEQRGKLDTARELELQLRKQQRELEDAKSTIEVEAARKLDAERLKIAEDARLKAIEQEKLNIADKDNKIKDLQEQIAALKQRSEQGSMQAQGETLELELESKLRSSFPFDEITEVKKGQRGADIIQQVRTNNGLLCGAILWEAKRAQNWSHDWPEKLKGDQREVKADLAVLVTTCLPDGIRGIGLHEGIWVCEPSLAAALAGVMRQGIISTATQRQQQNNRADKMEQLYDHLCSVGFRQNIEAIVESFMGLKEQLDTEKRAFARQWKEREAQLEKAITHTAMLYGGIQGIAGREALPEIQTLALPT